MKTQKLLLILSFLLSELVAFSQNPLIPPPKLVFDGNQLIISYDVIDRNKGDQFYVWVEVSKRNGEQIGSKALSGDVGDKINTGLNKKIYWLPAQDSVIIDEEVFVEVKAEKYIKSFNKSAAMLSSVALPGLGQTKISKGKPYWFTGVAAYGAIAGGFIVHSSYVKTYNSYRSEENPTNRVSLLNKAQKQLNLSNALVISGAALWAANIVWVAAIPNKYKPLQHAKLSLNKSTIPGNGTTLLTMSLNF
jgi:hypothetical protein